MAACCSGRGKKRRQKSPTFKKRETPDSVAKKELDLFGGKKICTTYFLIKISSKTLDYRQTFQQQKKVDMYIIYIYNLLCC